MRESMKWEMNGAACWIRLELNEEVMEGLGQCLEEAGIRSGAIMAIGALKDTELGYFDAERSEYLRESYPEEMELIQFLGNVTTVDGRPFVHAHAVISGRDFIPRSGHFFSGTVAVTFECQVIPGERAIGREFDGRTGLKLMEL